MPSSFLNTQQFVDLYQVRLTQILQHSQLAVGAGSPTDLKLADRLNKPALPHGKSSY
jgi:hypothetical protein